MTNKKNKSNSSVGVSKRLLTIHNANKGALKKLNTNVRCGKCK